MNPSAIGASAPGIELYDKKNRMNAPIPANSPEMANALIRSSLELYPEYVAAFNDCPAAIVLKPLFVLARNNHAAIAHTTNRAIPIAANAHSCPATNLVTSTFFASPEFIWNSSLFELFAYLLTK